MLIKALFFYLKIEKQRFLFFYTTVTEVKTCYRVIYVSLLSREKPNDFEGSIKYLS